MWLILPRRNPVEIVLRACIPDAGAKPLFQLIRKDARRRGPDSRQAEYLDYGRKIRNGMAAARPRTR
ncbi:hypothetical protein [Streptomyces sp. MN13]